MHVCCEEVAEEANAEAFLTSHLNPLSQYGCEEGEGQEGNMKYSAPKRLMSIVQPNHLPQQPFCHVASKLWNLLKQFVLVNILLQLHNFSACISNQNCINLFGSYFV